MSTARLFSILIVALALACGCANESSSYDPDWDPDSPVAGGKADGLFDAIPVLEIGGSATGDVGGENLELYRLELRRTDRIEVALRVTDGDLNPHLSLYRGTSSYVGSESWERVGDTLTKVYVAEEAGTFLLAVRAFRGEGSGDYEVGATCIGGPCAGELPPPGSELEASDVEQCVNQARRCSFERLPRYGGRVGEARANLLMQECLDASSLPDGSSCSSACAWVNPEDEDDTAAALCDDITSSLPFYADQSGECLALLDSCMGECISAAEWGYSWEGEIGYSAEAMCWMNGFNGTCDGYARGHSFCGGTILPDSSAECTALCHSTGGAHVDDLDTMCSYDSDCEEYCDVDIAAAASVCDGASVTNDACLFDYLDDHEGYNCESALSEQLYGETPDVSCDYANPSPVDAADTGALSGMSTARKTVTAGGDLTDLEAQQIYIAARHLGELRSYHRFARVFEQVDEGTYYLRDATVAGTSYDWVKAYAGDTEIGLLFVAGTLELVGEIGDGDIMGCLPR